MGRAAKVPVLTTRSTTRCRSASRSRHRWWAGTTAPLVRGRHPRRFDAQRAGDALDADGPPDRPVREGGFGKTPGLVAATVGLGGVDRRIFGLENEYGVTCTFKGQRRLIPGRGRALPVPPGRSLGPLQQRLPAQRRPALPRRRQPPRVRHPRVRRRRRPGHPRQGGGADPRGPARRRRAAAARRGHRRRDLPVQEQHRLGRQLLRLPRELPGRPARRVRPAGRRADPVPGHPADHLRRRQGAADRRAARSTPSASAPSTSGRASPAPPPGPGRSSTPATSRTPTPSGTAGCT